MRKFFRRLICLVLACIMTISGASFAFAKTSKASKTDRRQKHMERLIRRYAYEQKFDFHFEKSSYQVIKFRTIQLKTTQTGNKITYKSSNKKIANVSKTGKVTTKKAGIAVITARSGRLKCHCVIRVVGRNGSLSTRVRKRKQASSNTMEEFKPGRKSLLLAGSSAFDNWTGAAKTFSEFNVINNSIAGSSAKQWLGIYQDLIVSYDPDGVVIFVGSNDIGEDIGKTIKVSGSQCAARIQKLIGLIRESLGEEVPIFYVSMLQPPCRRRAWKQERKSNALMQKYCRATKNVYYIDVASSFMNKNGTAKTWLFKKDMLHPNQKGYKIYRRIIGKAVNKVMLKK